MLLRLHRAILCHSGEVDATMGETLTGDRLVWEYLNDRAYKHVPVTVVDLTIAIRNKITTVPQAFEHELASHQNNSDSASLDAATGNVSPEVEPIPTPVPADFPRGSKDWFRQMYITDPRTPSYWTVFHSQRSLKDWHAESEEVKPCVTGVDSTTFQAISKIVKDTWLSQWVGHGRDAQGLGNLNYTDINVKKVERIENTVSFEKYAQLRQDLFRKAAKSNGFKTLENVNHSSGKVMTTGNIQQGSVLAEEVYPEINEHYMFHGTKEALVDKIVNQGLDNRVAGSAMFGPGIYGAESATKADQYADVATSRSDGTKKMLLVRMCLGDIFVQKKARTFVRPPCHDCKKDKCTCEGSTLFDSVVGDGGWNFREFVIYDKTQVYPEYVITYERV